MVSITFTLLLLPGLGSFLGTIGGSMLMTCMRIFIVRIYLSCVHDLCYDCCNELC